MYPIHPPARAPVRSVEEEKEKLRIQKNKPNR